MTSVPSVRSARTVVVGAIVLLVLAGCTSGTSEARQADGAFAALEHVTAASTTMTRPGSPTNKKFSTALTVTADASDADVAATVDSALLIARDVLSPSMNVEYTLYVDDGYRAINMEPLLNDLGEVGDQQAGDVAVGRLRVSTDALAAYSSPRGES